MLADLEKLHPRSFAWSLLCCRGDRNEAEEVLQTVYLKILDGRARHEGKGELAPWLYAVIRHTAADRRRRSALSRLWFRQPTAELGQIAGESDTGRDAERGEATRRIRTLLSGLAPRQRQVLDLVFYHGLSLSEAAAALGVSVGSVRRHYHRGKERLRSALEKGE
jgi:RNA polymerase sigma-70 factor (ECF subfamily)